MRWVDCRLLFLISCCPYRGLVKAFLIATQRVKEEGWQSGSLSGFRFGSLLRVAELGRVVCTVIFAFAACCTVLYSFAACTTAWPRMHTEFRIRSVLHSLAACCTAWPRVAQLGRVGIALQRVAQLGRVRIALQRVAQLGRVLHIFAACSTAWPRVHSFAACSTDWPRVAQLCSV
jgi:hypothetical protein